MNVKVSVILPSLNVADYIKECLDSVIGQTLREIEILCVDAGSTDGTLEILREYARKDSRVNLLTCEYRSYGRQVNEGIRLAGGEYIAVVDTDDFIAEGMYQKLYGLAEEYDLDYVKADFDAFIELQRGGRVWALRKTFPVREELYGKVMKPLDYVCVYEGDYNMWKGIYRKDFLIQHGITLNETPGAAFQDTGFIQQTLCLAKRAMYIEDSFYCYRMNREGASTYQPEAARNAYQEFRRLFEGEIFPVETSRKVWKRLYYKLALSFPVEYEKVLRMEQYNTDSEYLSKFYEWFRKKVFCGIKEGMLSFSDFQQNYRLELELMLKSCKSYADYKYVRDKVEEEPFEKLLEKTGKNKTVIFGCGKYGKEICIKLDAYGVDVVAFCDNNEALWGTDCFGIEIMRPEVCYQKYGDAFYLVACRRDVEAMTRQLEGIGISKVCMTAWPML